MSRFLSPLRVELMVDASGNNLCNRDGRQLWQVVDDDFIYQSDVAGQTITVPMGFITDFASIPQACLSMFGEIAQRPSVIHDFLYTKVIVPRGIADKVLLEAMELTGVSWLQRKMIYAGVRVGGGSHYGKS